MTAESVKSKTSGFASTFATYKEYSAGEIFAYEAQKVFALPLLGKVACLFVLTIPIVFLGGLGYKLVDVLDGESGDDESFREKLKSGVLQPVRHPGRGRDDGRGLAQRRRDAGDRVRGHVRVRGDHRHHLRRDRHEGGGGEDGNNKVIEKDHTVVLNWNSQLVPLLKQMAVAKSERAGTFDKPVVLLADVDKELMDELVESALEDSPPLEVVTRRGNPFDTEDLVRSMRTTRGGSSSYTRTSATSGCWGRARATTTRLVPGIRLTHPVSRFQKKVSRSNNARRR